jgi:hypothetical protein
MARVPKGKKFVKVVKNPKTGRTKRVGYGAPGFKISPGTAKATATVLVLTVSNKKC